jgi:hypothetical protein
MYPGEAPLPLTQMDSPGWHIALPMPAVHNSYYEYSSDNPEDDELKSAGE